jgi:hypothetical protein
MPEYMRQRCITDGRINNAIDDEAEFLSNETEYWEKWHDLGLLFCVEEEILSGKLILSGLSRPRRNADGPEVMSPIEVRQDVPVEQLRSAYLKWTKYALEGFEKPGDPNPLWRFGNVLIRQPLPKMRDDISANAKLHLPIADQSPAIPEKSNRGASAQFDWAGCAVAVIKFIEVEGDSGKGSDTLARLEDAASGWFLLNTNKNGKAPGEIAIRNFVRSLRAHWQRERTLIVS